MAVTITKPPLSLRERLAALAGLSPPPQRHTFWFSGDSSTTDFALERGWSPVNVFSDGAIKRPGTGEDYTVAFDGFVYTVSFSVAPAAVDIAIIAEREVRA